jgi:hypothetical protein
MTENRDPKREAGEPKILVEHVRRKRTVGGKTVRNDPVATMVAFVKNGELLFGHSKRHPSKEPKQFSKADGVKLAVERACARNENGRSPYELLNGSVKISESGDVATGLSVPSAVSKKAPAFIERAERRFNAKFANVIESRAGDENADRESS